MKKPTNIIERIGWRRLLPIIGALLILVGMTVIFANDWRVLNSRDQDMPPVIEFTWTPLGVVDLKEFRGFLKMKDDHALDFTTYRMHIVEINKTYDLPIDGMIGNEYESPISLGLLTNNAALVGKRQLTIRFSISDDVGQKSELERIVKIRPPAVDNSSENDGFRQSIIIE